MAALWRTKSKLIAMAVGKAYPWVGAASLRWDARPLTGLIPTYRHRGRVAAPRGFESHPPLSTG
jgi:hypothetical protein